MLRVSFVAYDTVLPLSGNGHYATSGSAGSAGLGGLGGNLLRGGRI